MVSTSRNSLAESSLPLMMEGRTESHVHVWCPRLIDWLNSSGSLRIIVASFASEITEFFLRVVALSSAMVDWCITDWNSYFPQNAEMICLQATVDAVQFSPAISVRSGITSPAFFTGRHVSCPREPVRLYLPKCAGRNLERNADSILENLSSTPSVTHCKNCHSVLLELFLQASICGLWVVFRHVC
jgi:hypothetical protein